MHTRLVNGLAGLSFSAAVTIVSLACSKPGGTATHEASASGAAPVVVAGAITDSLSKAADESRIQGSPSAKLWVIEVSDFQCPYCKEWHDETYKTVLDDYVKTGKVRMAYVNFPLSIHAHAHQAAIAAMCAGAQNKFWQMHDSLFASQGKWEAEADPTAKFDSLAKSVGVDDAKYRACLTAPSIEALVAGDQERARGGGVRATPSFWVGGKLLEGAVPTSEMKQAINQALAAVK